MIKLKQLSNCVNKFIHLINRVKSDIYVTDDEINLLEEQVKCSSLEKERENVFSYSWIKITGEIMNFKIIEDQIIMTLLQNREHSRDTNKPYLYDIWLGSEIHDLCEKLHVGHKVFIIANLSYNIRLNKVVITPTNIWKLSFNV